METIRPGTTGPIPLRQSPQRMGGIMLRLVGLLLIAIAALALMLSPLARQLSGSNSGAVRHLPRDDTPTGARG